MPEPAAPHVSVFDQIHLGGVLSALLVIGATWFAVHLVSGFFAGLGRRFGDKRLVLHQVGTAARFVVWTAGVFLSVLALNLSKEFVLTLTGAAAVTVGFALKDLASSVLAGITILVDRPFQVGDRVSFGGFYGEITEIGLRSVRLVTLDDNVVTIPNNKFLTEISSSGNAGALDMLIQMDFFVGVDQDLPLAKRLVEECLLSNRFAYTKKSWSVLVSQMMVGNYFAYRIRAKAYVLDVRYEKAYETELTERVHEAFLRHRVGPPAMLVRGEVSPPAAGLAAPPRIQA